MSAELRLSDRESARAAREQDAQARRDALAIDRNLLLQAPAGSGKTTVLTARFLALLAQVGAPEEILAITFTRKAAAEMRQRLLRALQPPDRAPMPGIEPALRQAVQRRDVALGWKLGEYPARLRVETIDALNSRLAHASPASARAAPDLMIARDPQRLYHRAARRTLESAGCEAASRAAVERLFERLDNDWPRLQGLLADMLERRAHWLPWLLAGGRSLAERVEASLDTVIRTQLSAARGRLPAALLAEGARLLLATGRGPPAGGSSADAPADALLTEAPQSLPAWRALVALALSREGWRQRFTVQQGIARTDAALRARVARWVSALSVHPEAEPWLRELEQLPDPCLSGADAALLDALGLLLVQAAAQLELVFAETGQVDYTYMAGAARASLTEQGEPSELALSTTEALRHILVDEFQDISPDQLQLLRALTAGWQPGDGRSLFLVGDPMQSIYQFRQAEVGLFLRARVSGIGAVRLQPLQLRCNFRTCAPLLDWINATFACLFPREDDARLAAVAYLPAVSPQAQSAPVPTASPAVTVHRFEASDVTGEARRVLQIVRAAHEADPAASIAVLVASREHAARICSVLRAANLAIRGVKLERLAERAVVRDLCALTRALLHGADRTAWLALLHAPWCGLTLGELERLGDATADGLSWLTACAAALPPHEEPLRRRITRVSAALAPALAGPERNLALWRRVECCWLRLAGPAVHTSEVDRLDAHRYLDALAVADDPESLVGEALEQLTDRLFSSEPAQPQAVEVLTMHGAKGLEWDVVVLPRLGMRTAWDSDPLLHWAELPGCDPAAPDELLLAPIRSAEHEHEARGSVAAYIKRLKSERLRWERVRLLYVAATRARRALHLLGATRAGAGDSPPRPAPGSPLELLWPALADAFLAVAPPPPVSGDIAAVSGAAYGEVAGALPETGRLPDAWAPPAPPPPPQPRSLPLATGVSASAPEYRWVGLAARAVGIIVHAELQRLAAGSADSGAEPGGEEGAHYLTWLQELGVPAPERPEALERIRKALRLTLQDPRGRWLLSSAHREACSERRLTGMVEGRLVSVVIDRMLVDEQGRRWIIDYKTSEHEGGSIESFIETEGLRHLEQLRRYATLARALGREPVRAALYFPLLGVFRELQI